MKNNKRGISPVIATVLLVMLSVAAVAALASFIVPFVRDSLGRSGECLLYKEKYTFDESFGYNCYKDNVYAVSIKSSANANLESGSDRLKIVFISEDGQRSPIDIGKEFNASYAKDGAWIVGGGSTQLEVPGAGEILTYGYNSSKEVRFISAEAYPVLKSGRICGDEKDSISLVSCEAGEGASLK